MSYYADYIRLDYMPPYIVIYIIALCIILGLVMGSALNCLAYRMANNMKWARVHSTCPKCNHVLKPIDLVPVLSYVALRGKCRYCKAPMSSRYPITELTLALCYTALLLHFDLTIQTLVCMVLISCLFTLSLIDLDTQTIPNRFLIIPAACRILQLVIMDGWAALWSAVWPALCLGGAVLILSLVMDKLLGKESMGGGDIKLLFVLGLFFTIPEDLLLLIIACIVGLIIAAILGKLKSHKAFPFGPALSIAAFIVLLCGETVTGWYLSLF